MKPARIFSLFALLLPGYSQGIAQCSGWTNLQLQHSDFHNPIFGISLTARLDRQGQPYLYSADRNYGLRIFNVPTSGGTTFAGSVYSSNWDTLHANNLYQEGQYLYVALGNIFEADQPSGLAIVDVSTPNAPVVTDYYEYPDSLGGAACVKVRGDYAYLASMNNGLIVLNVSDKNNIQFAGQIDLSVNFPHSQEIKFSKYNARSVDLKGNYAFVCFDRGGLRVIDISNPAAMVQVNQYCDPDLINFQTAYNNLVIHHNLAFVTLDYYGMEVLDISDPLNIVQLSWWHPSTWAPATNDLNTWTTAEGHANEINYDSVCKMLYISAGRSDVLAISVADSTNPVTCEVYGSTTDDYGTWGVDYFDGRLIGTYIWSPLFPPQSNYTGFRGFKMNCLATGTQPKESVSLELFPNPVLDECRVRFSNPVREGKLELYDPMGHKCLEFTLSGQREMRLELAGPQGIYFLRLSIDNQISYQTILKQ